MKESNFQTMFGKWVLENKDFILNPTAWELKIEKGKSFRFEKVSDRQIESLLEVERVGLYHKINDLPVYKGSMTRFAKPKPFDCFYMKGKSYVVVWFYKPRQKKIMYWIPITEFIALKKLLLAEGRKSIKEEELKLHSFVYNFK